MKFWSVLTIAFCGFIALVIFGLVGRIEQSRESDPSGRYFAVWSHAPYQYLPIAGLGTGSDSPVYVKMIDRKGKNFGEIPVAMMQLADVEWRTSGAEIKLIGEWNFSAGTCFYWSENQMRKIRAR